MKIIQCWDDGNVDDIRLIEILRRYGAKASFNLNIGLHKEKRYINWRYNEKKDVWKLARRELLDVYNGFLVANHSLTHQCLSKISTAEAEDEIGNGKDSLEQLFGYEIKGFAYPFGAHNKIVEEIVHSTGHLYARTTGEGKKVYPPTDPMTFHPHCHFLDPHFWEKFEHAQKFDGVFYFWGHSYEIITEEDWRSFETKIDQLSAKPNISWANIRDVVTPRF